MDWLEGKQPRAKPTLVTTPFDTNPLSLELRGLTCSFGTTMLLNQAKNNLEMQRTPTVWHGFNVSAAGDTTIWTPQSGKRFRLLGYDVSVPNTTTCAGEIVAYFKDGNTVINQYVADLDVTVSNGFAKTVNYPGNGYLSLAPDTPLILSMTRALTHGWITINTWGNEE